MAKVVNLSAFRAAQQEAKGELPVPPPTLVLEDGTILVAAPVLPVGVLDGLGRANAGDYTGLGDTIRAAFPPQPNPKRKGELVPQKIEPLFELGVAELDALIEQLYSGEAGEPGESGASRGSSSSSGSRSRRTSPRSTGSTSR